MVNETLKILAVDATGSAARPELRELAPANEHSGAGWARDGNATLQRLCPGFLLGGR